MQLLDGKKVAESVYEKLHLDVSLLSVVPRLNVILVGSDPASQTYVKSKTKKCQELGLRGETILLPETVSQEELASQVEKLNKDSECHGILVQLPLPAHIQKNKILELIDPKKDVDGLHFTNMGRLLQGQPTFLPCTPAGVIEICKHYNIAMEGKHVVVLGRSEIVGKPAALLFLMQNSTVTICHSKTQNLAEATKLADILVVAIGKPKFVKADMVKEGATVIDVGIHRTDKGLCGDVDFDSVSPKASAITPVPGGVGPMTIAMLMRNVVEAARR